MILTHFSFLLLAQITQWGLILHGTETPAQPNDPPNFEIVDSDNHLLSELDQNSLDFDSDAASGQWRNMQQVNFFPFQCVRQHWLLTLIQLRSSSVFQVGESHVDVQRTAASNDQTDTACLSFLPNKYCIGLCTLLILSTYMLQMASINSTVSLAITTTLNRNQINNKFIMKTHSKRMVSDDVRMNESLTENSEHSQS